MARPNVTPLNVKSSTWPLSKERFSSGVDKVFFSIFGMNPRVDFLADLDKSESSTTIGLLMAEMWPGADPPSPRHLVGRRGQRPSGLRSGSEYLIRNVIDDPMPSIDADEVSEPSPLEHAWFSSKTGPGTECCLSTRFAACIKSSERLPVI